MRIRSSSQTYGAVAIGLHWAIVVLVAACWVTGQFGEALPRSQHKAALFVHISLGVAALGLTLVRLIWRLIDTPPAPEPTTLGSPSLTVWATRAGQAMHLLMYVLLLAIPVFGIVTQFGRGNALPLFGLIDIASPWVGDRAFAHSMKEVHEVLANAMLALVGLHAAAALVHHYALHDRTLLRMVPWARG